MGAFSYGGRRGGSPLLNKEDQDWKPVFHPIIRTHPETGRKSLYFDPGKIVDIVGCDRQESDALIAELKGYMIQPDAEYRHKWRKGDIVIWDNRCSYHKAAGDYPPEEDRIHWRVSINDYGVEFSRSRGLNVRVDLRATLPMTGRSSRHCEFPTGLRPTHPGRNRKQVAVPAEAGTHRLAARATVKMGPGFRRGSAQYSLSPRP